MAGRAAEGPGVGSRVGRGAGSGWARVGLGAQDGRDPGLPRVLALHVRVLDQEQAPRSQEQCGLLGQRADDLQPVGPAVERQVGIVVAHLRLPRDRLRRDVGRVGDHDVHTSAQLHEGPRGSCHHGGISLDELDRAASRGDPVRVVGDVPPCPLDGRG